ncbi:SMI1/KNR4 family protein [Saccharopolyspora sp. NPDC050389]|uniref:SMI1/KNR4 family protein n=1 Tax=Saccharopolyspora sp. NPDC050389 TaxID=3155516 RepID=UPI0033F6B591
MDPSPPSTVAEWCEFLQDHSSEFLASSFLREAEEDGRAKWMLSEAQREAGWLGYEPAGEEAVLAAEARLGVRLPPSYRNFLLASNGWSSMSYAVDLLNTEQLGWFADVEPELLDAWKSADMDEWVELVERCLLVSIDDGGAGNYWLLHADKVAENGEWTAYDWWPGDGDDPEPYDDFAVLVTNIRKDATE